MVEESRPAFKPMKKTTGLLIITTLAAAVFVTSRDLRKSSAKDAPAASNRSLSTIQPTSALPERTKSIRAMNSEAKAHIVRVDSPDASLPSVEETLRAARSTVFNFKHHLCLCQCDLDESKAMATLVKANLKWPRIPNELGSVATEHNLRVREEEALRMVDKDPVAAVAFMAAQIHYEAEKTATLKAAAPWRESVRASGAGDSRLFSQMLEGLPDSNFDGMVNENLALVAQSQEMRDITVENSFKRPSEVRLKTLARLADEGLLEGSPYQKRARAELVSLIGSAPVDDRSWLLEVAARL